MRLDKNALGGAPHRERKHPHKPIINAASTATTTPRIDPPRLNMNGPSNNAKEGKGFDWLECGIVFAGALVVIGLFMESWPELKSAIIEHRFPKLTVTGGVIVTIGVLIEVILGIFITQRASRAQSEAIERVAKAEQAMAEANLARAKLETAFVRRTTRRQFNQEEEAELVRALSEYAGQPFQVQESTPFAGDSVPKERKSEQAFFALQLQRILRRAAWIEQNESLLNNRVREGVKIFIEGQSAWKAAECLASRLADLQIDCVAGFSRELPVPLIICVGTLVA